MKYHTFFASAMILLATVCFAGKCDNAPTPGECQELDANCNIVNKPDGGACSGGCCYGGSCSSPQCYTLEQLGEDQNDADCPACKQYEGCPAKIWSTHYYKAVPACSGFASVQTFVITIEKQYSCDYISIDWTELTVVTALLEVECAGKCIQDSWDVAAVLAECAIAWIRDEECTGAADAGADCLDCLKDLFDPCRLFTGCQETGLPPIEIPAWTAVGAGSCP